LQLFAFVELLQFAFVLLLHLLHAQGVDGVEVGELFQVRQLLRWQLWCLGGFLLLMRMRLLFWFGDALGVEDGDYVVDALELHFVYNNYMVTFELRDY
jgi:hypothetical protein